MKIPTNFIYPNIPETAYHFGSQQVAGNVLRESGDWRDFLPPFELQRRNGIESASCFIQAQQHAIATLLEEQFDIKDSNFSERFNFILADGTSSGGDPLVGAQTFRDYGLIPDEMLPFSEDINSWGEFSSFGDDKEKCLVAGQQWKNTWSVHYDIVVRKEYDLEKKYTRLKEALRYSPVPVSVYAWEQNSAGEYIKPKGEDDNHLVELVYIDENNCPYVFDTYEPALKKLSANYDFDFALRYTLDKQPTIPVHNWFAELVKNIYTFVSDILTKKYAHQ